MNVQVVAAALYAGEWEIYEAPDPEKIKRLKEMDLALTLFWAMWKRLLGRNSAVSCQLN